MNSKEVKDYSPIVWALERFFYYLQWCSISSVFKIREHVQAGTVDKEVTKRRSRQIEYYIFGWFVAEILALPTIGTSNWLDKLILFCAVYRLLDILQVTMNVNLFGRLRIDVEPESVAFLARTVVLSVWNFIEAMILFGLVYRANIHLLNNAKTICDALYFSVVTQLTIGYGDLTPTSYLRAIIAAQGVLGFLVGIFAVSRVIAFLPKPQSVIGD